MINKIYKSILEIRKNLKTYLRHNAMANAYGISLNLKPIDFFERYKKNFI